MWARHPLSSVCWWLALLLWLAPRPAFAEEAPSRVSVLTMGPGDHPFTRFGHNAILLEWEDRGPERARVYNFGTFAFDGWGGVRDFMTGRFRYWLSVGSLESTLRGYGRAERSLTAQQLALTPTERAQIFRALERNAQPAHRFYDYDYYRDNCSTRVRDAIDDLLGGQLAESVRGHGRHTFRQHTLRLVGDAPLLTFGLDVALGRPTDRPISRWEELFLPQELHDELSRATRVMNGRRVPFVVSQRELLRARQPLPAAEPPPRAASYSLLGASLGAALALLGRRARGSLLARRAFGAVGLALGAALGLLGNALLVFMLSKHEAAHLNLSLLAISPLAFGVAWCSAGLLRPTRPAPRWLTRWLGLFLATSALLLLAALTSWGRAALPLALLCCPVWLGWLVGACAVTGRGRPSKATGPRFGD